MLAADDDADGVVCINALPSGNFIVHEDNGDVTPSQPCPPAWYVHGLKTGGGAEEPAEPAEPGKD